MTSSILRLVPVFVIAGCGGSQSMNSSPDLAPATVTELPQGCQSGVTGAMLYADVLGHNCASRTACHGAAQPMEYSVTSAAALQTMWVNKPSIEVPSMPYVTPNDVDHSYVMYKVMGQMGKVGGSGNRMPNGGPYLTDAEVCELVSWIQGGAN